MPMRRRPSGLMQWKMGRRLFLLYFKQLRLAERRLTVQRKGEEMIMPGRLSFSQAREEKRRHVKGEGGRRM